MSNYRAVIFDVDGTLVDSLEVFIRGLGDTYEEFLGFRPPREEIKALCGIPLTRQLALFQDTPPSPETLDRMVEHALARYEVHLDHEAPFVPALQTLRFFQDRGLKTGLVTSKNRQELSDFLTRFSSLAVDATVCASDVSQPKPAPEPALLACRLMDVEPHEAVFIGDSIYDMQCAQAAGLATVAVTYGACSRRDLAMEMPDLILDTPDELLEWAESTFLEPTCRELGS